MRSVIRSLLCLLAAAFLVGGWASSADAQSAKQREKQGRVYLSAQRWDDAIVEFKAALDAEPQRVAVLFALARAYEGKGDLQAAIDAYAKYPENGPDAE